MAADGGSVVGAADGALVGLTACQVCYLPHHNTRIVTISSWAGPGGLIPRVASIESTEHLAKSMPDILRGAKAIVKFVLA